jgi:hypothetical protein
LKFRIIALLVPVLCCLAASQFTKAELDAHKAWMDDAQDKKDDVREALAAKDATKLSAAAADIEKLTLQEQQFWARTSIAQAKELAAKNLGEAKEMLNAAKAGRFSEAGNAFGRLEKTCSSCHDQHFEKGL